MGRSILILIGIVAGVMLICGCQGEEGRIGPPGDQGIQGPGGIDPTALPPAGRYFAVGLTNGTIEGVNGNTAVYLTFDPEARSTRDTVAAYRVSVPPLIDGVDGEEPEWGEQKARLRLSFLNNVPGQQDPNIYELVCRAAWDEDNIYWFFQWKERRITARIEGRDTTLVAANASTSPMEIYFNNTERKIDRIDTVEISQDSSRVDTTYFRWLRVPILRVDTLPFCFGLPQPWPPICFDTVFGSDTTLIWASPQMGEDRLAVFFGDESVPNWANYAMAEFFNLPGAGSGLPANLFVDVWTWGSGTTDPVGIADDWIVTSAGCRPDVGSPPYIMNWMLPDSIPRYQSVFDPNYKTTEDLFVEIYPFWYYDAVGYSISGWAKNRAAFLPGIVTTIPSGSRADVYAASSFDDGTGTWTVEMKRARRTYAGDDIVF